MRTNLFARMRAFTHRSDVDGLSLAATSTHDSLMQGPQQASARLWRHFMPLHLDAAAPAGRPLALRFRHLEH